MLLRTSTPHLEKMQRYADEYFEETEKETATTREIAVWAIRTGRWEPPPGLLLMRCREEFSKAMREQYIRDRHGRPVRAKHVARVKQGDRQLHLWADIRRMSRKTIVSSFNMRREQIVGECRQLDRDKDFWNELHSDEEPIQLIFDFIEDVEEGVFSGEYPPRRPK